MASATRFIVPILYTEVCGRDEQTRQDLEALVARMDWQYVVSLCGGVAALSWRTGVEDARHQAELVTQVVHPRLYGPAVQRLIWAVNKIIGRPYVFGGGHSSFIASGYDCSGTVSYALHGGHLLKAPLDSSQFMGWGRAGQGQWLTVLTNPGHAYLDVAGLRLDTSAADDPTNQQGPRWRPLRPGNAGYTIRHPAGL